jgi:drug/metabolite transporter (DMT)-like permease
MRLSVTASGLLLVSASALLWSFGGTIGRFAALPDTAAVVFWRSLFGCGFLAAFMLLKDGWQQTVAGFRGLGWQGALVTLCFAVASASFIIAIQYTSIANVLLIQAAVPLIAAILGWALFAERISTSSILAIGAVGVGFSIMFGDFSGFSSEVAPEQTDSGRTVVGIAFAVCIAFFFAIATVTTRRASHIQMLPAVCLATFIAGAGAALFVSDFSVPFLKLGWLFLFGVVNLGLGLALFTLGARLIPAVLVALIGTIEPVLGPVWAWLVHAEALPMQAMVGGALVIGAVYIKIIADWLTSARQA